jgi:hypothetical protein
MCPDFEHHDPGGQHCDRGHPIRWASDCNVIVWVTNGDGVSDSYDDGWPPCFLDGPIEVEWTGEGYVWHYQFPPERGTDA